MRRLRAAVIRHAKRKPATSAMLRVSESERIKSLVGLADREATKADAEADAFTGAGQGQ